jgi:hypothetical protein
LFVQRSLISNSVYKYASAIVFNKLLKTKIRETHKKTKNTLAIEYFKSLQTEYAHTLALSNLDHGIINVWCIFKSKVEIKEEREEIW